jgi:hypothetical protein
MEDTLWKFGTYCDLIKNTCQEREGCRNCYGTWAFCGHEREEHPAVCFYLNFPCLHCATCIVCPLSNVVQNT